MVECVARHCYPVLSTLPLMIGLFVCTKLSDNFHGNPESSKVVIIIMKGISYTVLYIQYLTTIQFLSKYT